MKINLANIKKAKKLLILSECVAIPTETVYGLAGNAYSNLACKKIYKLKKRPKYNPSIVHYSNLKQLKNDCILNKNFFVLYKKYTQIIYTVCLVSVHMRIEYFINRFNFIIN